MKKAINLATLLYLLIHTQYNISMHNENNFTTDKEPNVFEINRALQTLQPSAHQTIQERYEEAWQVFEESPYSIITQTPPNGDFNEQVIKELQEIEEAYQTLKEYGLENKLTSEIVEENSPLFEKLQKKEKSQATFSHNETTDKNKTTVIATHNDEAIDTTDETVDTADETTEAIDTTDKTIDTYYEAIDTYYEIPSRNEALKILNLDQDASKREIEEAGVDAEEYYTLGHINEKTFKKRKKAVEFLISNQTELDIPDNQYNIPNQQKTLNDEYNVPDEQEGLSALHYFSQNSSQQAISSKMFDYEAQFTMGEINREQYEEIQKEFQSITNKRD